MDDNSRIDRGRHPFSLTVLPIYDTNTTNSNGTGLEKVFDVGIKTHSTISSQRRGIS